MNSGTVLAGNDGVTTMTQGLPQMLATGAMSPDEIEVELFVERRIHCVRRDDQEQRVAIRPRDDDNFGTDTAASARPVLNDEFLSEPLRQPFAREPREDVGRVTGWESNDEAHRPRRISIRPCEPRHRRKRDGAHCQMQKLSAAKFHDDPPRA